MVYERYPGLDLDSAWLFKLPMEEWETTRVTSTRENPVWFTGKTSIESFLSNVAIVTENMRREGKLIDSPERDMPNNEIGELFDDKESEDEIDDNKEE